MIYSIWITKEKDLYENKAINVILALLMSTVLSRAFKNCNNCSAPIDQS